MSQLLTNIGLYLAVALLLCLFPMPYDYYTLVRFASMIIFACFAFSFYKEKNTRFMVIAISLAILSEESQLTAFSQRNLLSTLCVLLITNWPSFDYFRRIHVILKHREDTTNFWNISNSADDGVRFCSKVPRNENPI